MFNCHLWSKYLVFLSSTTKILPGTESGKVFRKYNSKNLLKQMIYEFLPHNGTLLHSTYASYSESDVTESSSQPSSLSCTNGRRDFNNELNSLLLNSLLVPRGSSLQEVRLISFRFLQAPITWLKTMQKGWWLFGWKKKKKLISWLKIKLITWMKRYGR